MPSEKGKKIVTGKVDIGKEGPKLESIWKLYIDGASSFDVLGAGLMLIIHEEREYTYALCFEFETTKNEAEYEALLSGLRIAREMEIKSLAIFTDSQLMANKIKGIFEARQPTIKKYLEKVKEILKGFDTITIDHDLLRNSQGESSFTLTYGSEAIPPSAESLTLIIKEHNSKYKRKEGEDREVTSIEEAYYQNKLQRYYDTRSSRSRFKLGDFVLLFQGNKKGHNVWEGPHIISGVYETELYKITYASDYSLVQSPNGTSLQG
uniref:Reverse transcriptase domain-containing protein n=1 Tax=Tanacetum cinerariifolium TaxID=118510 RepID=A0A699HLJ6_TANCI|nr:reverse transcriptase domain-containing protein [Tanacetum cinerariifolium]